MLPVHQDQHGRHNYGIKESFCPVRDHNKMTSSFKLTHLLSSLTFELFP